MKTSTDTEPTPERIRRVAAVIKQDMEDDVRRFAGQPLAGRIVAEMHGNLAAAISALAGMVDKLTEHVDDAIREHAENVPHLYADGSS
ncbi:MAG TPA: hypothetical protein VFB19_18720 [Mycobacterium sp.]|nr:hypothetical protein [Mycobacterium sp.]